MRPHRRVAVLTAALLMAMSVLVLPASAQDGLRVEVIAENLDNPRGIDVGADGTVYVAESGSGGDEFCMTAPGPEGEMERCAGGSSTVTAIDADGEVSTAIGDLPSMMAGEGEFVGASDVAVAADGSLYVTIGLGGDTDLRDDFEAGWSPAGSFGTLQHFQDDELSELADLAQWEADNDPDSAEPSHEGPEGQPSNDSNPNGLLLTSAGELFAADAGGNTVLEIDTDTGEVELAGLFADRMVDVPAFIGAPVGTQMPMQSVPTNLTEGSEGEVFVSELTGFPFPVGGARVYTLGEDTTPDVHAEGFTNIMDLVELDGELYVLEFAHDSLLGGMQGALVRVRADGTRIALLRDVLVAPGGIAAGPDGMLYITNMSVGEPGSGSVIRFDPSQAADPATQAACPPLEVPGTELTDVADTTHEEAITCVAWHGLFSGFGDGTFGPDQDITRGQFATTVAQLITATGAELATGGEGQFSDVDGTTHAAAINDLAAADLVAGFADGTYGPQEQVTREQAVSILVAAYEFVTEEELAEGPDVFADVSGTHEANVNAAAAMGWVQGTSATTFAPTANITRGQMASTLARVAADLVAEGHLELPS